MHRTVIEMSFLLQLLGCVILILGVADGQNVPVIETHTVLKGEPLSLNCPLTITMDWLVWKRDGNVISYYSEGSTTDKGNNSVTVDVQRSISTLELNNIGFTDAGNYSCTQYELSLSTESKKREWRVQVQGQLAVTLNATSTVEGENISATCCVEYASYSKYDNVGYFWSVNEDPLTVVSTTQERIERNENRRNACSSVMFRSLSIYNAKMLVCRTSSFPNHFSTAVLNVQYKPVVHKLPRADELYVKIGKEIKIICNVNGNPNPNVSLEEKLSNETWQTSRMKPSRVIQESVTTKFGVTFSWRVKEESLVFYRCMAENFLGTSYSDETEVISYRGIWSRGRFFITAAVLLTICVAAATIFWIKTMRKSGVDIARKESIISLHYNRELNDGDYETEAGDSQIADVSNSYMAVEDSKLYATDEFPSPSTVSGKNIKQLKVASDDKEKYDGCIAKDNEQDKEIYEIDDLFTVCSESVKDMSGKSKTCLPGNEKDVAGKIYDLVEASVTEISEKSDNANENTDHAYDRIDKSEKEKTENISKKGARRKNYDKLNTLRLQTK